MVAVASGTAGGDDGGASGRPLTKAQPGHRSYNLQERRRIGSMTGAEQALLPRVPTDESEAQTLATADLDLMKSECWAWAKPSACGNRVKRKGKPDPALLPPRSPVRGCSWGSATLGTEECQRVRAEWPGRT